MNDYLLNPKLKLKIMTESIFNVDTEAIVISTGLEQNQNTFKLHCNKIF